METLWGPQGCGDHMGITWRQHADNVGTTGKRSCTDSGLFGEWSTSFAILQNASSGHQNSCYSPGSNETSIQIHPTQKHSKLSIFEETIIEMFNLPENIKELVPVSSPLPDLELQTATATA